MDTFVRRAGHAPWTVGFRGQEYVAAAEAAGVTLHIEGVAGFLNPSRSSLRGSAMCNRKG